MGSPEDSETSEYYDAFAEHYDDPRGGSVPSGYHDLIDDLEVELVERFARDRDLLEVGCGTGLLLQRFARFAKRARGIDISRGMLSRASSRGLEVTVASATDIPFEDETFDVTCAFKVLPHVRDVHTALAEMFRVTKRGGVVIAEFYNANSVRALAKRIAGAQRIGDGKDEASVFVRLDTVDEMHARFPSTSQPIAARGIRILTPAASVLSLPLVGRALGVVERALSDTPLRRFGGFYALAYRKKA